MRIRSTLGGVFASIAILTMGWQFGSAAASSFAAKSGQTTSQSVATPSAAASSAPSAAGTTAATPSASASSASSAGSVSGTFTGAVEQTRYGTVQVQITVSSSKITEVTALKLTDDGGRSVQISNQAAPILRSEVLKSQSAKVSSVSGATYTSDGYLSSLQSAIDKAGI